MDSYEHLLQKVMKAVKKEIPDTDKHLQEIALKTLLDDALSGGEESKKAAKKKRTSSHGKGFRLKKGKIRRKSTAILPYREEAVREEVVRAFSKISGEVKGLKPITSFDMQWEKYLWVLEVASKRGVDRLTNNDIAYVLNKKIPIGGVTEKKVNNLKLKVEDSYVQITEAEGKKAWQITLKGKEYVKSGGSDEKNKE